MTEMKTHQNTKLLQSTWNNFKLKVICGVGAGGVLNPLYFMIFLEIPNETNLFLIYGE